MAFSVTSSTSGVSNTNQINRNDRTQNQVSQRLASGKRINRASDGAASLAISSVLASDVASLRQSSSNLLQGTALLQTADGALEQAGNILNRMKDLATQANSGSLDANSRNAINEEYQNLSGELNNLTNNTTFNGQKLVDGSFNQNFQSGTDGTNTLSADLTSVDLSLGGLGLTALGGTDPNALTTQAGAVATSNELDTAINNLASYRSQVGSIQSQFTTRGDVLETDTENAIAAQSALQDADIGQESSNFASSNLLSDVSLAAAAQGNRMSKAMLKLVGR
ncbi:MAG TPA: flagellin [Alphaproteobacteria bacterium]|nr:flagellin [Alphaproteobacteria bacterium]HNS43625.1 flagellin [Alphaproteobacteria bacterium]